MLRTGRKFSKPELSRVINGDKILAQAQDREPLFRLDQLLLEQHPNYTRATIQYFITSGFISVNNIIIKKPSAKYTKQDQINLTLPPKVNPPKLKIIYEDNNVLVIDKPAGLLSMAKGAYCPEPTLEDYGLLVHRLDRATSGVIILAKNSTTKTLLQKQFSSRKVKKTYYALVHHTPKLPQAIIDLPIARNLKIPTTFKIDPNGKSATTTYEVVKSNSNLSLLKLTPATGRTHQLRVHLSHIGHPIVGDPIYGLKQDKIHSRLFLHAASLEITIPKGQRKTFSSPLPPSFTANL